MLRELLEGIAEGIALCAVIFCVLVLIIACGALLETP